MPKEFDLKQRELQALKVLRNWLMQKGAMPSVRELMKELDYKSPRSVAELLDSLVSKKFVKKKEDGTLLLLKDVVGKDRVITVNIPILGSVACGLPLFAEQNIEGYIPVSAEIIKGSTKYFLLKAKGDSMNLAGINDGDFVLIKQQQTANDGDLVVALIDDEATIKKLSVQQNAVLLRPVSNNSKHKPILLNRDFLVQGIVIMSFK